MFQYTCRALSQWLQLKYSFVLMLISLSSLTTTIKFQKNICLRMREVGVININTKECRGDRRL